jgi:hypothetical protein
MKRTVFLVLALFALMAVGVYAQTEADFSVQKLSDGKSVTIIYYEGKATTVNIPAKIQNLPVTSISGNAFEGVRNSITSVTIPNGVTSIGDMAFARCEKLTSVIIPNSVNRIGKLAFQRTGLTSVGIPNGVIGTNAFENCKSLTSVTIGSGVTSIGDLAFNGCEKLTSVTIGSGVKSIGKAAFFDCTSLTSVTFSGSIPSSDFHAEAFSGLGDIRDKYLATGGGAGTYTRPNGTSTAWTKGGSSTAAPAAAGTAGLAFTAINSNKEYSVAKGTVTSGAVVIPASYNNLPVTTIADNAFVGTQITAVTIPDSVKTIGGNAFVDCKGLTSVTIGNGVTNIGAGAFARTGITSITIPVHNSDSLISIGNNAFLDCAGLKNVTILGRVESIGDGAFARTGIASITIPASVRKIGKNAFMNCTNLTSVTLSAIPSLDKDAFGGIGDLWDKHYMGNAGTYTRPSGGTTWTKK